jgi:hypothetical protein
VLQKRLPDVFLTYDSQVANLHPNAAGTCMLRKDIPQFSGDRDLRFPWFPISTAIGLFGCQWALIFWNAHEASTFARETGGYGYGSME